MFARVWRVDGEPFCTLEETYDEAMSADPPCGDDDVPISGVFPILDPDAQTGGGIDCSKILTILRAMDDMMGQPEMEDFLSYVFLSGFKAGRLS